VLPYGVAGLAILGIVISAAWFPIAYLLGRYFERSQNSAAGTTV
jgi:hypothetical protein